MGVARMLRSALEQHVRGAGFDRAMLQPGVLQAGTIVLNQCCGYRGVVSLVPHLDNPARLYCAKMSLPADLQLATADFPAPAVR